jgi:hypothetical protein
LARLAVVYKDELRMKIVTEAYMREISPKMFFDEFGGGSVSRVARHFERLAESAWLKLERTKTGGKRRGGVEHFYRATELVVFELDDWSTLPSSMRAAFSWTTFEQLTERVCAAVKAGTLNARADRHLSCTPTLLDRLGWERVIADLGSLFEAVLEEQDCAKRRIGETGERPALATVALAGFESPLWLRNGSDRRGRDYAASDPTGSTKGIETPFFFPKLAKVLADPLDLQIMDELNTREMSPKRFHAEWEGATVSSFSRRLVKLKNDGWAQLVREETGGERRGATEHFYRASGPAFVDSDSWAGVPDPLKATATWRTFEQLRERVKEALDVGTFDARTDRHLTWSLLLLDQAGWEEVVGAVDAFFEGLSGEEKNAKRRTAESGEQPILATVGLAAFESPKDAIKAP